MKQRKLGKNGFKVSEVGLGCWQIGADWGSPIGRDVAFAILSEAFASGMTFLDTANVYGGGRSESLIGEFMRAHQVSPRVATKFGRGDVYPDQYTEANMRESVQASLARLGVGRLDLLQLHCVPTRVLAEGVIFDWLRKLQAEGLIAHFGASVETVEQGLICLEQSGLLSLQVILNCFRQKPVTDLLPQAAKAGVGVVVRLPLASGLLSGKFSASTSFAAEDHRNYNRDGNRFNVGETFAGLPFEEGVELADALKDIIPSGMTMAQFALRWILDHDAVSSVIPGASDPAQARSNALASTMDPLPAALHEQLHRFYTSRVHGNIRGGY